MLRPADRNSYPFQGMSQQSKTRRMTFFRQKIIIFGPVIHNRRMRQSTPRIPECSQTAQVTYLIVNLSLSRAASQGVDAGVSITARTNNEGWVSRTPTDIEDPLLRIRYFTNNFTFLQTQRDIIFVPMGSSKKDFQ